MYYFAYGSNMSSRRLQRRIDAIRIGTGRLSRYQLRFHKVGKNDGTGKCDILFTDNPGDYVDGVIFEIADRDKVILDQIEGKGIGYDAILVDIEREEESIRAYAYIATDIDASLQPLDWYKTHVLYGAIENNLEDGYIEMIRSIPVIMDIDIKRKKDELSIYA